jgi:hypothetical protein
VPLFAPPVSGPLRIPKGERFSSAGPVEATIYYRDLPSLEPLRRMVREEKGLVRATVRLLPELSLVQRIALWTSTTWVSWKVERSVKVQLPGGMPGKTAAELALAGADAMWVVGQKGLQWRRERDVFTQSARQNYGSRVLPVETSYMVLTRKGQKSSLVWRGLAFHVGDGEVVAPAEAVEPWLFDAAISEAVAAGAMDVIPETLEVSVGGYSLQKGAVTIGYVGRDNGKGLSVERRKTFSLRDRASVANIAQLKIPALRGARVNATSEVGEVAVFRRRDEGGLELLLLSAAMENGRPQLLEPVDSRALGSPVMHATGVLGIVVAQTAIAPLRDTR